MAHLVIVEDSPVLGMIVTKRLKDATDLELTWVKSYTALRDFLDTTEATIDYALVDLNLPDVDGMEMIDYVIEKGIGTVVFTGDCTDDTRDVIWSRKVVDYVLKEGGYNVDYLVYLFHRLEANRSVRIILVDDSSLYRQKLAGTLRTQNFIVETCASGQEALETLEKFPDTKLVLTDYTMAGMDGFELVNRIRKDHPKDTLAVVGMSYRGDNRLSARFLKCGASDFLDKSFTTEQFYCRINQNIDTIELVQNLREASVKDYLTGLYNRRYLYECGETLVRGAYRRAARVMLAMIDIDRFKHINDTFGHASGDEVISFVAKQLNERFRGSDIVARFGGEEFCILACDVDPESIVLALEEIRMKIASTPVTVEMQNISVTVSIGLKISTEVSLQEMIEEADNRLYQAKDRGRNQIVSEAFSKVSPGDA